MKRILKVAVLLGACCLPGAALPAAAAGVSLIPQPEAVLHEAGSFTLTAATPVLVGDGPRVRAIGEYFAALLHDSGAPTLQVRPLHGAAPATVPSSSASTRRRMIAPRATGSASSRRASSSPRARRRDFSMAR